jgi:hypothetical protein
LFDDAEPQLLSFSRLQLLAFLQFIRLQMQQVNVDLGICSWFPHAMQQHPPAVDDAPFCFH